MQELPPLTILIHLTIFQIRHVIYDVHILALMIAKNKNNTASPLVTESCVRQELRKPDENNLAIRIITKDGEL